jgi:hypothetical protein
MSRLELLGGASDFFSWVRVCKNTSVKIKAGNGKVIPAVKCHYAMKQGGNATAWGKCGKARSSRLLFAVWYKWRWVVSSIYPATLPRKWDLMFSHVLQIWRFFIKRFYGCAFSEVCMHIAVTWYFNIFLEGMHILARLFRVYQFHTLKANTN